MKKYREEGRKNSSITKNREDACLQECSVSSLLFSNEEESIRAIRLFSTFVYS